MYGCWWTVELPEDGSARRAPIRRQEVRQVKTLFVLVLVVACCSSCVTRTISRTPTLAESASGRFNSDGKVVEKQTIWIWQR